MYTFGIRRSGRERGGGVQFLALGRTQGGKTDKVLKGGRGGLQFIGGSLGKAKRQGVRRKVGGILAEGSRESAGEGMIPGGSGHSRG